MALKAKTTGGDGEAWPQAPVGNHRAVCVAVIDLGHHYEEFKAQRPGEKDSAGFKPKVYLVFELLDEAQEDGKPWVIGKQYTNSLTETSRLRPVYEALVGPVPKGSKDEDITPILGKACMVDIKPSTNPKYTELKTVASPIGVDVKRPPKSTITPFAFDIDDGEELLDPEWMPRIYGKPVGQVIADSRERSPTPGPSAAVKAAAASGSV